MVSQITLSALKTKEDYYLKKLEIENKRKAFEASLEQDKQEVLRLCASHAIQETKVPIFDSLYYEAMIDSLKKRYEC